MTQLCSLSTRAYLLEVRQVGTVRVPLPSLLLAALLLAPPSAARAQHIDIRVHDPVLIRQDHTYYLFHTGSGIAVWSSTDMRNWTREPPVFATAPVWAADVVPNFRNHIWAPDIYRHNGTYYLYYSVSAFGRNTSAIGVATNRTLQRDDPGFAWQDHGIVVRSVPGRDLWNAIDPNVVHDDDGTPWLSFGSFWLGIKLVKLNQNMLTLAQPEEWYTIAARQREWTVNDRSAGGALNAIEAPFIFKRNGFYYLFVSWDVCCRGAQSTYRVMVGRAEKVTGPYLDREGKDLRHGGGSLVVAGNSGWAGVGHNSAYTFDGTDYLVFHGYHLADQGRSKLWISKLVWDEDGWPSVSLDF
jgi:arabinan endo-1,5-alpha-L-arabinosidase